MIILITEDGRYITEGTEAPEVGRRYTLEDAQTGTGAQNRAFHALVQEYWRDGSHPKYGGEGMTFDEFRDCIKRDLGAGFESYVYAEIVDGKPLIRKAKSFDDIPEEVRLDPDLKEMILGKLKSWTKYGKRQRKNTIDNLIQDMRGAGVNSRKFAEILEGMQSD